MLLVEVILFFLNLIAFGRITAAIHVCASSYRRVSALREYRNAVGVIALAISQSVVFRQVASAIVGVFFLAKVVVKSAKSKLSFL